MPTKIQYASDLHLDYFPPNIQFNEFVKPCAPTLVLAGDIASVWSHVYSEFLTWCSVNWKTVILITGNHEYFCSKGNPHTRLDTDQRVDQMCAFLGNVHFLQNGQSYTLPNTNIVFIGATLYSEIDPKIYDEIFVKSDYRKTYTLRNKRLAYTEPEDLVAIHRRHKQALSDAIRAVPRNYKAIVVTHYLPTTKLLEPEYQNDRWRSCYASNLHDLFRPPVKIWICGHGHRSAYVVGPHNITIAMNARGYKQYEVNRTVDIYKPTMGFIL
jgi:UDP-2,3-diacylglucosamine pyrophosphatase LpxH